MPYPFQRATADTIIRWVAATAILAGFLVLFGWAWRIEILKSLLPGLPGMSGSTAICFILAGICMLSATGAWQGEQLAPRLIGWTALFIVFVVALFRFSQYFFRWESAFISAWVHSISAHPAGRMAS